MLAVIRSKTVEDCRNGETFETDPARQANEKMRKGIEWS